jgi:hypothetical protein
MGKAVSGLSVNQDLRKQLVDARQEILVLHSNRPKRIAAIIREAIHPIWARVSEEGIS